MQNDHLKNLKIALVGNPNVGKSSLFNELTGLNQKVGNFSGVTVEKKEGKVKITPSLTASVLDLPGTYSLDASSEDEKITTSYIQQIKGENEIIVLVADATSLKKNLLLCSQIMDAGKQVILVLNMMDIAQKNKQEIKIDLLSKLLKIPVVPMNARIGKGIDELKYAISNFDFSKTSAFLSEERQQNAFDETLLRFNKIGRIIEQCSVSAAQESKSSRINKKIDNILIHPFFGYPIFLLILFIIFQAIFSWSTYPMEWIENGFILLGAATKSILPEGILSDLLIDGVLAGLGGIVIFIPQIALLFVFLSILEDTGYLSRVSFLLDHSFRKLGLNGKSIIPLLSGTACAVPAIMSARSIQDKKERLITIFVTPLMSCSARIPVYTLLIALIIPKESVVLGIFNLQGFIMLLLYLLGAIAAVATALILKLLIKTKEKSPSVFELPIYRAPRWKSIGTNVFNKVRTFISEAGKIIIAISILLWALSSYGPKKVNDDLKITSIEKTTNIENSYAGHLGKVIEPVIKPLGFDWKIGISLITSFAAREVFVSTMATIYAAGDEENTKPLREKMYAATWPKSEAKIYTKATTYALLVFYAFAMQCMSTIAVVKKETKSWKWPLLQLTYLSVLAYLCSYMVYQIFI